MVDWVQETGVREYRLHRRSHILEPAVVGDPSPSLATGAGLLSLARHRTQCETERRLHTWLWNLDFGQPSGDNAGVIEGTGLGPLWVHSPPVMLDAIVQEWTSYRACGKDQ